MIYNALMDAISPCTQSHRVTLKFEVSHTDHSHVIGKGGSNIKRVMQETGCHIHFPDSNRNHQTDKSNQVCDNRFKSSAGSEPCQADLIELCFKILVNIVVGLVEALSYNLPCFIVYFYVNVFSDIINYIYADLLLGFSGWIVFRGRRSST